MHTAPEKFQFQFNFLQIGSLQRWWLPKGLTHLPVITIQNLELKKKTIMTEHLIMTLLTWNKTKALRILH